MASIKLRMRGNKNPSPIYLRLINGRNLDIEVKINVFLDPSAWDPKGERIRNIISIPNRDKLNKQLQDLKGYILNEHNESFMYGKTLDKEWLEDSISGFFKRPKNEGKQSFRSELVYVTDFSQWWLDNKASTWKTPKYNSMPSNTQSHYQGAINKFKDFEGRNKIKLSEISSDVVYKWVEHLKGSNYSVNTMKKNYDRLRFFLNRAEGEGIKDVGIIDGRIYFEKDDSMEDSVPYLNESEIEKIMNLDLSNDFSLDAVRDNFIISLWTGLRISDFNNNLDVANIDENYINIKTTKTGTWVVIPLHPNVKSVLNKRAGALPTRVADATFNRQVKLVVQLSGIDNIIKGSLFSAKTKRKEDGMFPKYKLISAHTGRRSFATNLFGLVPNSVIMAVGGWKKEDMMLHYIKRTRVESSTILKAQWDHKYNQTNL